MRIKVFLGKLHLWIGLSLSVLFFIVAFSGALYTWAPEISRVIYRQAVTPQPAPFVPVSKLKATLDREFPSGDFRTALYRDSATTLEVLLYGNGTYYHAELDPYSGALVHLQDMNTGWLNYLKFLHRNLILGKVGRKIVHWVTLLFLIMLMTGLVLWWPARRRDRRHRFSIKWGASPRKLNYDLHNVLGFYATWVVVFCVITGIFWGFEVVRTSLQAFTGEHEMTYDQPKSVVDTTTAGDQFALLDSLMITYRERFPGKSIRISNPHQADEPVRLVVIQPNPLVHNVDHYYFDRYSGEQLVGDFEYDLSEKASTFHKINGLVYDIHFGTVLGLPGRLLVFFASLIASSLPITGFLVWWARRRRSGPVTG